VLLIPILYNTLKGNPRRAHGEAGASNEHSTQSTK
jgi:hypothetical protein